MGRSLRTLPHAAFKCQGFTGHELEVRAGKLDANPSDFSFCISVVTHWRHLHIRLERIRVGLLKLFQLSGPCQRTDDVDIDTVLAPFGGSDTGQAADAFFGSSVGALSEIAEQTCAGSKIDHAAMRFFQVGIPSMQTAILRLIR